MRATGKRFNWNEHTLFSLSPNRQDTRSHFPGARLSACAGTNYRCFIAGWMSSDKIFGMTFSKRIKSVLSVTILHRVEGFPVNDCCAYP